MIRSSVAYSHNHLHYFHNADTFPKVRNVNVDPYDLLLSGYPIQCCYMGTFPQKAFSKAGYSIGGYSIGGDPIGGLSVRTAQVVHYRYPGRVAHT